MITRAQMRRQLRAQGGIMNVAPREKFGLGSTFQKYKDKVVDRTRKIIPNELANVAAKAAPIVAMIPGYGPLAGGLMRGFGRLDKRGDLTDALKQGALTFGGGKLFDAGMREAGLRDSGASGLGKFFNEGTRSSIGNIFKGEAGGGGGDDESKNFIQKGKDIFKRGTDFLSDKVPGFDKLDDIVKEKLLVGGVTGAATYLYNKFLGDEPPQDEGETYEQYTARRKENVGRKMRTYMDNYFANDPEYMQLDDAGRDAFVARYNVRDGGRIGYQTGGVSLGNTLQQNIAANKQQAAGIQALLNQARASANLPTVSAPAQTISAPAQTAAPAPAPSITKPTSTPTQTTSQPASAQQVANMMLSSGPMSSSKSFTATPQSMPSQPASAQQVANMMLSSGPMSSSKSFTATPQSMPSQPASAQQVANMMLSSSPMSSSRSFTATPQATQPTYQGFTADEIANMSAQESMANFGYGVGRTRASDDLIKFMLKYIPNLVGTVAPTVGTMEYLPGETNQEYKDRVNASNPAENFFLSPEQEQQAFSDRMGFMGGSMPMGQPRVNQGGITELDFRAKGGFVPVGIKEKADDVPAMLSKNEFVFTADAVKGAGNGSVEKGAQKMYDTMKNLERRVT